MAWSNTNLVPTGKLWQTSVATSSVVTGHQPPLVDHFTTAATFSIPYLVTERVAERSVCMDTKTHTSQRSLYAIPRGRGHISIKRRHDTVKMPVKGESRQQENQSEA